MMAVDTGRFIESNPERWEGWPMIVGTGVTVARIGIMRRQGYTPDQIAYEKTLTLAQVYAALAHYEANREAIDAAVEAYDAETRRIADEWAATGRRQ
mgnify:CR=1 FL=1